MQLQAKLLSKLTGGYVHVLIIIDSNLLLGLQIILSALVHFVDDKMMLWRVEKILTMVNFKPAKKGIKT